MHEDAHYSVIYSSEQLSKPEMPRARETVKEITAQLNDGRISFHLKYWSVSMAWKIPLMLC